MTLNEHQRTKLIVEFLDDDCHRSPRGEAEVARIKRSLTRSLFENPAASPEDVISWVVGALDKVVTAWEKSPAKIHEQVTNGVRQAATIICEAAERAGLTMPDQPTPEPRYQVSDAERLADRHEVVDESHEFTAEDTERITKALNELPANRVISGPTADGQPPADWTPSDGGLTPSMFGGI